MQRCDDCGVVYDQLSRAELPAMLRRQPARYAAALRRARSAGLARTRPEPRTWSALEYTCHVRDVLRVQHERLRLALRDDRPTFEPMGRDELAVRDRYNDQDPERVLAGLGDAAEALAGALEDLDEPGWRRTGIYNWPERAERTMAWLARHTAHEAVHHLRDIERGLRRTAGTPHPGRRGPPGRAGGPVG